MKRYPKKIPTMCLIGLAVPSFEIRTEWFRHYTLFVAIVSQYWASWIRVHLLTYLRESWLSCYGIVCVCVCVCVCACVWNTVERLLYGNVYITYLCSRQPIPEMYVDLILCSILYNTQDCTSLILGAFLKQLQKATISIVVSVLPTSWKNFRDILCLGFLRTLLNHTNGNSIYFNLLGCIIYNRSWWKNVLSEFVDLLFV